MFAVIASAITRVAQDRPPGLKGTLSGVEQCASGSLSLSRFTCLTGSGCADTPSESVFLRWSSQTASVRKGSRWEEGTEIAITEAQRDAFLKAFAEIAPRPDDPSWPASGPMMSVDGFWVGGECDEASITSGRSFFRQDLMLSLKNAPLEELPSVVTRSFRGPGPRAERLFRRIEKLAQ